MPKSLSVFFSFFILTGTLLVSAQKTSFKIGVETIYLDGNDAAYQDVDPGDTLFFAPGNRKYLLIKNLKGAAGKPIVLMNSGGEVIIDTDHYFGISIQNCRYFRLTGTGDPKSSYGFKIKRVANGGGMGIGELSSDFEIDHVSVENCMIGGIYAKTDPDCSLASVRGTFTQFNTIIHDNYIANVGDEGLYIGNTKYNGQTISCGGKDLLLLPGLLEGVKIYNNIIKYSGWDGIQVSSASKKCAIYNNTVLYDSQLETESQMSGILIGGGSKCDCYNNFISQGKGNGIESHGLGGYRIYNNLIIDAGRTFWPNDLTRMKHGIFVTDVSVLPDSSFYIQHNNLINSKSEGIRFSSVKSKNNLISSNAIINPGNFEYYENDNTSFNGNDAYVMFQYTASDVQLRNNYFARSAGPAVFRSTNKLDPDGFKLASGSPLINAAETDPKIAFDFAGFPRPFGAASDIGAFEYNATGISYLDTERTEYQNNLLENPVKDDLKISIPNKPDEPTGLDLYNSGGQLIRKLSIPEIITGNPYIQTNVANLPSGIYFYRLCCGKIRISGTFLKK